MHKFLIILLFCLNFTIVAGTAGKTLPALPWQTRSDWLNVKKDIQPVAKGDGIADDTAAIQAALDKLNIRPKGYKGIFIPAGTYRITGTITNKQQDLPGVLIVGSGRDTKIIWDGAKDGVMFRSNGIQRSRYVGIIWDGNNRAAIGVDHRSDKRYETRVLHQNEAFLNFTDTGIRIGYQQKVASAEMTFENCLFENCVKNGVSFLSWNDYDNTFTGCGFYNCGIAVNVVRGNVYVRNSHFENSTVSDLSLCPHSHSVRRCTSLNSNMFIQAPAGSANQEVVVEDCQVSGWKNKNGAIITKLRGPNFIFDTVFTNPPNNTPPIRLDNGKYIEQLVIVSNNSFKGGKKLVDSGVNSRMTEIPAGKLQGTLKDPKQTFLKSNWRIPGKVFDVKQYGAKGNGRTDDTKALKATIEAAAKHGNDAIAYLPAGIYKVTETIVLTGGKYFLGGSGFNSIIQWHGKADSTVLRIVKPQDIVLEHLQIKAPATVCMIAHKGTKDGSMMTYDEVYVGGSWQKNKKLIRGLECLDLGVKDTVLMRHFDGSMKFVNCANAKVLVNLSIDGTLEVQGNQQQKKGFVGMLTRICSGNAYDVIVRDSQSLVVSDFYTEQTERHLLMSGNKGDTAGTVLIQGAKVGTNQVDSFLIDNYHGMLFFGSAQFCYKAPHVVQQGTNPVDIMFVGNMFWDVEPKFNIKGKGNLIMVENLVAGKGKHALKNSYNGAELKKVAAGLDLLRRLGKLDLEMNYPNVK
jgi:pectate lyase-like protein